MLTDDSIMIKSYKFNFIMISIYVNDLLITVTLIKLIIKVKVTLCKKFRMQNLKETRMIIEMRIIRHKTKKLLTLNQTSYIRDVLQEKSLLQCNSMFIFMKLKSYIILKNDDDVVQTEIIAY